MNIKCSLFCLCSLPIMLLLSFQIIRLFAHVVLFIKNFGSDKTESGWTQQRKTQKWDPSALNLRAFQRDIY